MAYLYDNFADAFAAQEYNWETAQARLESSETQRGLAFTAWNSGDDHTAILRLISALDFTNRSLRYLARFQETDPDQSPLMQSIYWAAQGGGGGGVTMDAILSAMVTSNFNNLRTFVGLVDAYRVALWNKPFNSEYYAALARGFTI